jgi:hypothetical protein
VIRGSGIGNRLLAALPPADFDLLALSLETVALDQATVLSRAGDRIEHVLLPHSGAISLTAVTAIVRAAGTASRIAACRFHAAFNRSPAIRHAVQINIRAMLIQLQLGAACNALHPVEARMARWLLHIRDRIDHDVLPLTQDALSQILGVQRTTVTLLMRNLRASGAIRSDRRGQIEIDRSRLAAAACECHSNMRFEVEEIFSMNTARSRVLVVPADAVGETGDAM